MPSNVNFSARRYNRKVTTVSIAFVVFFIIYYVSSRVSPVLMLPEEAGDITRPGLSPTEGEGQEYDKINAYFSKLTTSEGTYYSATLSMDNKIRKVRGQDDASYALLNPPFQSSHGSNLLLIPSGEVLLVWFSGEDEGGDGVAIVVSTLRPGEKEWSQAKVVSQERGRSAQNPVLYFDSEKNELILMHTSQRAFEGQATSEVRKVVSKDKGLTWSKPTTLFEDPGAFLRNQVMLSGDEKEWLLPMYYTPQGFFHHRSQYSSIKRSKDGVGWQETIMQGTKGRCVQPSLVRLDKQTLQAFFRSRDADSIYLSVSQDDGYTWTSPTATRLPNNNSGIQALRLLSGNIAIVFNNVEGDYARWPLSIALSDDDSQTFRWVRDLEPIADDYDEDAGYGEYSYPSLTQSPDGMIHVSYTFRRETIKYVQVTEQWIKQSTKSRGVYGGT